MYAKHALVLNSGPLQDLGITFAFDENDFPTPTIIVGRNGVGKSNFLSIITDALIEIAAHKFYDAAPQHLGGHRWHRVIGRSTTRTGSTYELGLINFFDSDDQLTYVSKGGQLTRHEIAGRLASFPPSLSWPPQGSHKEVTGATQNIEKIFREGCYASFPSNRAEHPYWASEATKDESSGFQPTFANQLRKPILVSTSLSDLKPWLVDVLMDQMVDASLATLAPNPQLPHIRRVWEELIRSAEKQSIVLHNFNALLKAILQEPDARLIRTGRAALERKLQIFKGDLPLLPSLDSLSSGQASLLSIFSTVLRYADAGSTALRTEEIRGIVLIDEVDVHLHADLQFAVLPQLIGLFPRVQFIMTAHTPLFPLGMERKFGEQGFNLIELPDGTRITAERFSEFLISFEFLQKTRAFDHAVAHRTSMLQRPLVLCEGETDPKYLQTAAQLLSFDRLVDGVDFDWIGQMIDGQARDGGEGQLRQAKKLLKNNPMLINAPTILLFDCDVSDKNEDDGNLHVRVLERDESNERCDKGIENLLPSFVFEESFFDTETCKQGANEITKKVLKKKQMCDYLCDEKREKEDFEGFRSALEMIEKAIWAEVIENRIDRPGSEAVH